MGLLHFSALPSMIFLFPFKHFYFPAHACLKVIGLIIVLFHKNQMFSLPSASSMHLWIHMVFTVHHVLPRMHCLTDCVARPGCCMDADGLFMGDATLRKIFCLQETLRGVGGGPPLTESLLQADSVLFLLSPLLQEEQDTQ